MSRKIRVLVVDDVHELAKALADALGEHGIEVLGTAADGVEAVTMAKALDPDVVLMDIRMPVMDGIKATRVIANIGRDTRVLMLTAYEDPSLIHEAMEAGANGYLVKGTLVSDTVRAIEAVVKKRRRGVA